MAQQFAIWQGKSSVVCQMALERLAAQRQPCRMAKDVAPPYPPLAALTRLRKAQGLSLEELAFKVELSSSQLSRFENGQRDPRISELQNIARVLEVEIGVLTAGDDEEMDGHRGPRRSGLLPIQIVGRTAAGVFREVVEFEDPEPEYVFEPEDPDFPQARRFALEVEGDSMNAADPPIPDGSRVVCVDFEQTGQPILEDMIVVIERVREGGHLREWSVKQVEIHGDEIWFCPRSNTKTYRPIKIINDPDAPEWGKLQIIGLVRDVTQKVRTPRPRKA